MNQIVAYKKHSIFIIDQVELENDEATYRTGHRLCWGAPTGAQPSRFASVRLGKRTAPLGDARGGAAMACAVGQLERTRTLSGKVATVQALAVAGGKRLAMVQNQTLRVWDVDLWQWQKESVSCQGVVVFDHDGSLLEVKDKKLMRHHHGQTQTLGELRVQPQAMAVHPGGKVLYLASKQEILGWDMEAQQSLGVLYDAPVAIVGMQCSHSAVLTLDTAGKVSRYEIRNYKLYSSPPMRSTPAGISALGLGPSGELMYVVPEGVVVQPLSGPKRQIDGIVGTAHALAVHDDKLYVAGSAGVQIFNWKTGAQMGQFCPLKDGGHVWSAGEYFAASSQQALSHIDIYRVNDRGKEKHADEDQRHEYLRYYDDFKCVRAVLYGPSQQPVRLSMINPFGVGTVIGLLLK